MSAVGPVGVHVPHVDQLVFVQQEPVLFERSQAVPKVLGVLLPGQERGDIEYGFCGFQVQRRRPEAGLAHVLA